MNIAFVNQPLGPLSVPPAGAVSIWSHEVARRLAPSAAVVVYGLGRPGAGPVITSEGVRYRPMASRMDPLVGGFLKTAARFNGKRPPPFAHRWSYRGYARAVAADAARRGADIVHIHNFSQFVPIVRSLHPPARIALHMHCEWLTQLDPVMIEGRLRNVDLVLGCSPFVTRKIQDRFPALADRCRTVPNGVDVGRFTERDARAPAPPATERRVLFVGRITPEKGLHVLVDAFPRVLAKVPDAVLEIVGAEWRTPFDYLVALDDELDNAQFEQFYRGRYLDRLLDRAAPATRGRIRCSGFVPQRELPARYRAADVLVNPSYSESFGMSLVEAMASGVPVVATRVGGMCDVVEHRRTGLLVPPGDPEALAAAVISILENPELRESLGRAGRARAVAAFSWERVVEYLRESYATLAL